MHFRSSLLSTHAAFIRGYLHHPDNNYSLSPEKRDLGILNILVFTYILELFIAIVNDL